MRTRRIGFLLASAALSVVPPAAPATAVEPASGCVTVEGVNSCTFVCLPDHVVSVQVVGSKYAGGRVRCGTSTTAYCYVAGPACQGFGLHGNLVTTATCDVLYGSVATCQSRPDIPWPAAGR